jgi:hypothetical protein
MFAIVLVSQFHINLNSSRCYIRVWFKAGYFGPQCLTPSFVNPCLNNPCSNGGTCTVISSNQYICACCNGWTGNTCQISTYQPPQPPQPIIANPYEKSHILNHLILECVLWNINNKLKCWIKRCFSLPCQNGGTCTSTSTGGYSCRCTSPFYGQNCQYCTVNTTSIHLSNRMLLLLSVLFSLLAEFLIKLY